MHTYTEAQSQAIDCIDEPLQIIACAGSGKTQVISERVGRILAEDHVQPKNVIAFTFTDRAAAELKERILTVLNVGDHGTQGLAEMYVGTMHGYALDLIQGMVPEAFKFSVLTETTNRLFVDRSSRKTGLSSCPKLNGGTLRRYVNSDLFLQAMSVLREDDVDEGTVPDGVQESFGSYMNELYGGAYFDYTEIINLAVQYLETDPSSDDGARTIQHHISDDIKYVIVDEYQDVNPLQERLIKGLTRHGANLCVVGDDDQTIYQWRGSAVSNILTFSDRYNGVRQVTLASNFRSSPGIVEFGRSVAELIPRDQRLSKAMEAGGHQEWSRGDMLAISFDDPAEEAGWICDRIEAMRGLSFQDSPEADPRGLSWSDFAVLYRSVKDAGPLVDELRQRGIPYVVKGLNRLFESPEIEAVVGVFRYMVNRIGADELRALWDNAQLLPDGADWERGLAVLDEGRDFERGERWGVYNIQRLYLELLETLEIREETLPGDPVRRELVFYQLGKFSQAISDFEQIHFSSPPERKYEDFANWLEHQAPSYYAESDADVGYATPDAVAISTVHQAKGRQWPTVFIPCLRRNRFPHQRIGGLNLFHVIPEDAVPDADRYRGTVEDETRLFYVAVTRAQKYLFATHSPGSGNFKRPSSFFVHCTEHVRFLTRDPGVTSNADRLEPRAHYETPRVTLSFSELKYLFECPYQFKLRFLYGFNPPIHEALGFGKGIHDALAEVHKRALDGEVLDQAAAAELVERHLHTPFAYPQLREDLTRSAIESVGRYLREHGDDLARTLHSEKQIQVHISPGITVDGRIDLVRRLDTDETSIVDFKSTDRAQADDVTRDQLHVYAVGYEDLTGERADLIEVLNLDESGKTTRELVDTQLLDGTRERVRQAGEALRQNDLPRHQEWCSHCDICDLAELCRSVPPEAKRKRRSAVGR